MFGLARVGAMRVSSGIIIMIEVYQIVVPGRKIMMEVCSLKGFLCEFFQNPL